MKSRRKKPPARRSAQGVKHHGSPDHRQDMVRKCAMCGRRFHPRANGYAATQKYCDAACARKGRQKFGAFQSSGQGPQDVDPTLDSDFND